MAYTDAHLPIILFNRSIWYASGMIGTGMNFNKVIENTMFLYAHSSFPAYTYIPLHT